MVVWREKIGKDGGECFARGVTLVEEDDGGRLEDEVRMKREEASLLSSARLPAVPYSRHS